MTTSEFSNEFDILYNNISSNAAPGVTEYEKSVFLTMAQEEFVKEVYGVYEQNEEIRQYLQTLIKNKVIYGKSAVFLTDTAYNIPENFLFLINSYKKINHKNIPVLIIPHDQFFKIKDNPFKTTNNNKVIGIIMDNKIFTYEEPIKQYERQPELYIVYLEKPKPIILTDLEDVTIGDENIKTECELPSSVHYDILKRAVQLALASNGIAAKENV